MARFVVFGISLVSVFGLAEHFCIVEVFISPYRAPPFPALWLAQLRLIGRSTISGILRISLVPGAPPAPTHKRYPGRGPNTQIAPQTRKGITSALWSPLRVCGAKVAPPAGAVGPLRAPIPPRPTMRGGCSRPKWPAFFLCRGPGPGGPGGPGPGRMRYAPGRPGSGAGLVAPSAPYPTKFRPLAPLIAPNVMKM